MLVAVLLSAQCTDKRVNLVTPALFALASTPEEMARQDVEAPSETYHLFTCIITISDSLDAATDSYGRNYASSKTFTRVLEEMKNDQNRYHAELVQFIEECVPLREELSYIIRCKRAEVYEHVYHLLKERQSKTRESGSGRSSRLNMDGEIFP